METIKDTFLVLLERQELLSQLPKATALRPGCVSPSPHTTGPEKRFPNPNCIKERTRHYQYQRGKTALLVSLKKKKC